MISDTLGRGGRGGGTKKGKYLQTSFMDGPQALLLKLEFYYLIKHVLITEVFSPLLNWLTHERACHNLYIEKQFF